MEEPGAHFSREGRLSCVSSRPWNSSAGLALGSGGGGGAPVVDAAEDGERSSPFDGDRIELSDDELRRTSPAAWVSGLVSRLDDAATRLVYGSR